MKSKEQEYCDKCDSYYDDYISCKCNPLKFEKNIVDKVFKRMEAMENISKALVQFQAEFKGVDLDGKGHNYRYATLGNIVNKIRPVMEKCGLSFNHAYIKENSTMRCTIVHSSGETLVSEVPFLVEENGRTKGMQAIGTAITYARRYSLAAALGISDEDDNDCPSVEEKFVFPFNIGKNIKKGDSFEKHKLNLEELFKWCEDNWKGPKVSQTQKKILAEMKEFLYE